MAKIRYMSNNSGGGWWLTDSDWYALEAAGWNVQWVKDGYISLIGTGDGDGRWLGALAASATREGLSLHEAIQEWERVTHEDADAEGCSCCGRPHYFYEEDN